MRVRACALITVLSLPLTAAAQESTAELARRELLTQAEGASDGGDHARALELATRAARVRMTPSLRLLLAQEHNALGHTIAALDAATRCEREVQADTTLRNRERLLATCAELSATLRARVGRVVVRLEDPPPGARVTVNGEALAAALWGVAWPALPGAVVVVVEADGYAPFRREVELAAGREETVAVALVAVAASPAPPAPTPTRTVAATRGGAGAGPWVLLGAGALSAGAGLVFWRLQEGALADRDAACTTRACQPAAYEANDAARTWNLAANVAWGVGGAAAAGGALWWLLARPARTPSPTAWSVTVAPLARGAAIVGGGTF
jgi:hypothetical protein